jgi:hypothetical protein
VNKGGTTFALTYNLSRHAPPATRHASHFLRNSVAGVDFVVAGSTMN